MLLRSRWVLPITAPPIEDGAVFLDKGMIQWVGPWRDLPPSLPNSPIDLGNSVLSPGFVNAHCHLEYSHFAGLIPSQEDFVAWIDRILTLKKQSSPDACVASWHQGYRQLLETGTTLIADIVSVPEVWALRRANTPLPLGPRIRSFFEATGVLLGLAPEQLTEGLAQRLQECTPHTFPSPASPPAPAITADPNSSDHWPAFGVAPHSPYATTPAFLKAVAHRARLNQWPVTLHLAESAAEFEMFTQGSGPLYDWLNRFRPPEHTARQSPVQYVAGLGMLLPQLLAAHVNYLANGDAETLRTAQVHVVHCPRSHAYFNHRKFPIEALTDAGVSVCLGSDSLASIRPDEKQPPQLSMQAELCCFLSQNPSISPTQALKMATLQGARAMGCPAGELRAGKWADITVTQLHNPNDDPTEAVIHHFGPVRGTIIRGNWVQGEQTSAIRPPAIISSPHD